MTCSGDFDLDENFENLLIKNCFANGPLLNISTIGRINLTEKTLDIHGDFDINSDEKMKHKTKYKIYGPIENPLFNVM